MNEHELVKIHKAHDELQAHMIRSALEAEGIQTFIEGDPLLGAIGEIPQVSVAEPHILVAESDEANARLVLEKLEIPNPST